jgi:hypothetical protein
MCISWGQHVAHEILMLPTETFKMKHLLTFSLTNAIQNAKSFLKNCELFVFGDVHCVTNAICHSVLKIVTPCHMQ